MQRNKQTEKEAHNNARIYLAEAHLQAQQSNDVLLEGHRGFGRTNALDRHAVRIAQELGEVPFQLVAQDTATHAVAQVHEQRMRFRSVLAVQMAHHVVGNAFLRHKTFYHRVVQRFLSHKIIAREGEDRQSLVATRSKWHEEYQ